MALAGVKCNDSCKISFDEMHVSIIRQAQPLIGRKRSNSRHIPLCMQLKKKHRFITFQIDHGEIVPDIISEPDK